MFSDKEWESPFDAVPVRRPAFPFDLGRGVAG